MLNVVQLFQLSVLMVVRTIDSIGNCRRSIACPWPLPGHYQDFGQTHPNGEQSADWVEGVTILVVILLSNP